ncbi:hypothetical protein D3C87_1220100 [compost metagenome]
MDFNKGYRVVFVKCKETSLRFFMEVPGFEFYETIEIQGKECPILKLNNEDFVMLVEKDSAEQDTIILKTDDCLRDYHLFKQKSLTTLAKPRYVDNGLELCFSDPNGNQFIMLEERDYTDA